jgi:hypothetical protein
MIDSRRSARWALAVVAALAAFPAGASAAAPTVTTSPADASLLTDTYALIGGIINPGGSATSYQFEWGRTTAYGQSTPITAAGNGTADVPVDYSLDSLTPRTTYHYRLVALAPNGDPASRVVGADQTFTTTRALALSITGHRAKLKGGKTSFTLKAVGPPETAADGIATVQAVIGKQVRTLALKSYSVSTGEKKTFSVRLPASIRKVLAEKDHSKVLLRVSAKTSGIKKAVVKNLKVVG